LDCFAEPVIGRRFAPTRWLAMTAELIESHFIALQPALYLSPAFSPRSFGLAAA
jgi:hypothetical protein